MKYFQLRAATLSISFAFAGAALAGNPIDGVLDLTFGNSGVRIINFDQHEMLPVDKAYDVLADSARRTYVVGTVEAAEGLRMGIVRLNPNGSIDNSYGPNGNGRVVAPAAADFDLTHEVRAAWDAEGYLLVAGTTTAVGDNSNFTVCRFDPNGEPADFSAIAMECRSVPFDLGGQVANTDVLHDVVVQSDGKIVLVGYAVSQWSPTLLEGAIARLNPNGTLDGTFGTGGKQHFLPNGSSQVRLKAAAIQANGKIVVACDRMVLNFNDSDPCVARFTSAGILDSSFDSDGFQHYRGFDGANDSSIYGIALVPSQNSQFVFDETIVIAGKRESSAGSGFYDGLVARMLINSLPDSSFDGDGFLLDPFGADLVFNDIEFHYDGTVMLAGTQTLVNNAKQFYVTRFDWNGARDTASFNPPSGFISIDVAPSVMQNRDEGYAMAFHPNRIVVAGISQLTASDDDYVVAALMRDRIFHDGVEQGFD